ncbi:MAG: FecR domain-containing protein [Sphingomonas taxi]
MSVARDIENQAARWLMRSEEAAWSSEDQAALDAWLDQSMAHKAAFWRLRHGWRQADRIGALGARAVVARPTFRARIGATPWPWLALAASLVLACTALLHMLPFGTDTDGSTPQRIATRVGGHTIVPLKDGSRIELNTATAIQAAVTPASRRVWLDRGEAYFEVAHSKEHPFVVYAGQRTITVLGTKFSVKRDGDRVTVAVVEGRVRIDGARQPAETASSSTVTRGDIAIAQGASMLIATDRSERVEAGLAWRQGMLVFDQQTIGEVAAEFNRYNSIPVVVSDPHVARIRIGGTFKAANVDAFVRLLRDAYGLHVKHGAQAIEITG